MKLERAHKAGEPERLLRTLMKCFYSSDAGLTWGYREDVTIREVIDLETEEKLRSYMEKTP